MTELSFTSAYADDTGDKSSGTVVNKAFFEAIQTSINALIHSTTNTGVTPEDVIDEVVEARGSEVSLDARLDVILNEDGTLKTQSGLVTTAQLAVHQGFRNWVDDSRFEIWPTDDSSAPALWTLSGTGAAVARSGSGLGDTVNPSDWGGFAAKVTYGSAAAKLTRTMISSSQMLERLKGKTVVFGGWMRASAANQGSLVIDDGVTQSRAGESGTGTYHDGDSADAWVYGSHTISASATKLDVYIECAVSGTVYASALCVGLGTVVLTDWTPERWGYLVAQERVRGTLATGTLVNGEWAYRFQLGMGILLRTTLLVRTAPTGAALIIDPKRGAANSIYTTKPQIADGALANGSPGERPDGTYAWRCFINGSGLVFDIDQVGSSVAGADLTAAFYFKVPLGTVDLLEAADS